MIKFTTGNLLADDAEALVNTVNCVGFMGKGIALQFKRAYPDNFTVYSAACERGEVAPGQMLVFETGQLVGPKYIFNFPTKRHWRARSRLDDIKTGLTALIAEVRKRNIREIAVPPLGCGYGGLDWQVVRPLIERAFQELPEVAVHLYEPRDSPAAKAMPMGSSPPRMTRARALFIALMDQYSVLEYPRTLLEIHKLAYLLQEAGEPLRLRYQAHHYGPYADNLNKVLERIEGHFTRGYGDTQAPDTQIELLPEAVKVARRFLEKHDEARERVRRVAELIDGYETPYGMELLASVHWAAAYHDPAARSADDATDVLQTWNARKRNLFKPKHIALAWERLRERGWIDHVGGQAPQETGP